MNTTETKAQPLSRVDAPNRRSARGLLIYPKFQLQLMGTIALILVVTFAAIGVQAWRSFQHIESLALATGLPAEHALFKFLHMQLMNLLSYLAGALVISGVFTGFMALRISHRVAGPIVRLIGYFAQIRQEGAVREKLSFRKGDYFQELPEAINSATESFENSGHK